MNYSSVPLVLLVLADIELARVAAMIIFAISFLAGGIHKKILSGNVNG